jgi:hypothetical protein
LSREKVGWPDSQESPIARDPRLLKARPARILAPLEPGYGVGLHLPNGGRPRRITAPHQRMAKRHSGTRTLQEETAASSHIFTIPRNKRPGGIKECGLPPTSDAAEALAEGLAPERGDHRMRLPSRPSSLRQHVPRRRDNRRWRLRLHLVRPFSGAVRVAHPSQSPRLARKLTWQFLMWHGLPARANTAKMAVLPGDSSWLNTYQPMSKCSTWNATDVESLPARAQEKWIRFT